MQATQTETSQTPSFPNLIAKRSCKNCAHLNICSLFRAIAPLIENWKGDPPITPTDLAQICSEFLSKTVAASFSP